MAMLPQIDSNSKDVVLTATPHLEIVFELAAEMTTVLKDQRQFVLSRALRELSQLENWNRVAMGRRYVADDQIDIEIAVLRRALRAVAELSTAKFHPVKNENCCPACNAQLAPIDISSNRQVIGCDACLTLVHNSIHRLCDHFGLLPPPIQISSMYDVWCRYFQ